MLLEAVLQHLCSSALCLQQVSLPIPVEAVVDAQRQVSLQFFLRPFFSFSPVTITCSGRSFHCGSHCIPMRYESSLESSRPKVLLIGTVHSALLRHIMLTLYHGISHLLGIGFCTSEPTSILLDIELQMVCDKFHCAGCSFPSRSLPFTFLCAFAQSVKLLETLLL